MIPEFLALVFLLPWGTNLFAIGEVEANQRPAKIRDGLRKSDRKKERTLEVNVF